jgi:hypothetical protein
VFDALLKAWALAPWKPFVLLAPALILALKALLEARERRRRRAFALGTLAVGAVLAVPVGCDRLGEAPAALYVVERDDGGPRAIAAVTTLFSRAGVPSCLLFSWELPSGALVDADQTRGPCTSTSTGVLVAEPDVKPAQLAEGRFGAGLRERLAQDGPLPGTAEVRVVTSTASQVTVTLQDGSLRTVSIASPGARRLELGPPVAPKVPGVHRARSLERACPCTGDCELIAFQDTSFGDGKHLVGLVLREAAGERLAWSRPVVELVGVNEAPAGTFADGPHCVLAAGRSGAGVALGWFELTTGELGRRVRL